MGVCGVVGYVCFGCVVLESIPMNGMLFAFVGFSVLIVASYVVGWLIMRDYEKKGHAYE